MLYLVRHAKAGSRRDWEGDDCERPLTPADVVQAQALAERLRPLARGLLLSSPYVRCVQTLEPLAATLGTTVRADERLAEACAYAPVIELLSTVPAGTVLCSHGDLIPETIDALVRRGCVVAGAADWRKASVWVLHRDDEGAVSRAACWPPPDI